MTDIGVQERTRLQRPARVTSCPVGKRLPARFWGLDPQEVKP